VFRDEGEHRFRDEAEQFQADPGIISTGQWRWTTQWRGAEFITEPIPKYGEIRCYIRDPDGYIIEVGQSTDQVYG
jgi:hypothetical protein